MPKEPRIQDPKKRQLVITIVMGLLFAGSLGAAVLISGAGLGF